VAVLSAFLHLVVFAAVTDVRTFGGTLLILLIALPVLALHVAVWAVARFSTPWGAVAAFVLNACMAAAGWFYWAARPEVATMTQEKAMANAFVFVAAGLVTSALLIGWLRFTRLRTARR
jgi:hypothetical protein